ncbi:MAG TPA: porin [Steroidobacteraceae bacterium]|nr:porin [Steroidobacteraceae bacterium]
MRYLILVNAIATVCFASVSVQAADETTKVSGYGFIDLTDLSKTTTTKASGAEVDDKGNGIGLDVKRFYVGIDHVFDDTWSANVTTDFQYASAISNTEVFIKKAYLQMKVNDGFVLRAGSSEMPWTSFVEPQYGFRYIEKTATDLGGVANTTDWGLHATGKFADGIVNYAVSVVNGGGFKNPTRSKTMDVEARIGVMPVKGLSIGIGAYTGKRGLETDLNPAEKNYTRYDAMIGYVSDRFRLGAEYYLARNLSTVQQDGTANPNGTIPSAARIDSDKAHAISGWASVNFTSRIAAFLRYDDVKSSPSDSINPNRENTSKYWHAGVGFQLRKNIDLALAYKNTKTDTNFGTTSSSTNEFGLWSQLKF